MIRAYLAVPFAVLLMLADAGPVRAQHVFGPGYPPGHGNRFAFQNGLGFSYHRHGVRVAGFATGFYSRSVFLAPVGPIWPVLPPVTTLTPFGWAPGFLPPGWGVGPGWGWFAPPPVIVVPPPIILAGGRDNPDEGNPALAFENLPRPIDELPRGARPGDFLVIRPKRDVPAPGQIEPAVARVAAARPPAPAFRFDPFAKRFPVDAEVRDPDPAKESRRLVAVGRAAFAAGEYGRAAEQFDRAIASDPKAPLPRFLKGQASFASGRHAEAVAAIRAGLDLDPAWPTGTFDPKEPYGVNAAAFAGHLANLRKLAAANPAEATLEFLLGYQLWFIGEKVEARKWFDAAGSRLAAPGPIALFK